MSSVSQTQVFDDSRQALGLGESVLPISSGTITEEYSSNVGSR